MNKYAKSGVAHTVALAEAMLQSSLHKSNEEFRTSLHGEICETVLEILILDYMRVHKKDTESWILKKGLILQDPENKESDYLTEVDLSLFTPQKIFVFECKSYAGNKIICDKCTIKRDKGIFDVYKQNEAHGIVMHKNLEAFRLYKPETAGLKDLQLVLFDFSLGSCKDVRGEAFKRLMPCTNKENVLLLFRNLQVEPVLWKMIGVSKAVEIIAKASIKNRSKHLKYVKQLKH